MGSCFMFFGLLPNSISRCSLNVLRCKGVIYIKSTPATPPPLLGVQYLGMVIFLSHFDSSYDSYTEEGVLDESDSATPAQLNSLYRPCAGYIGRTKYQPM
jgi:hypothetical protein